jgi:hypothetical protein
VRRHFRSRVGHFAADFEAVARAEPDFIMLLKVQATVDVQLLSNSRRD